MTAKPAKHESSATESNQSLARTLVPSDRREFVKSSLVGTAAIGLGTSFLQRSVHAAGDDILRVGLVGCGGRGTGAASNVMTADKYAHLVAMADLFPDRLEQSRRLLEKDKNANQYQVDDDHCYVGLDAYQQLLDNAEVDVVCLCTPPHFRPAMLEAAIKAGKHVFCEKPVAVDSAGVRKVLELTKQAEEKGLNLVSGLCWRYDRGVKATMARIKEGAIGDIRAVQENYLTGTLWHRGHKPEWSDMEFQMRNWLYFKWLSGDHIVEQFIHSLDKSLWLHNDEPPVAAYGQGGRQVRTGEEFGDVFDHFSVIYEWSDGTRTHAFTRQMAGCFNQTEDFVYGTKGTAQILANTTSGEAGDWKFDGEKPSMYDEEHRALFSAIREGKPINNGTYMSYSTLMAIMGREVCYSGRTITWEELLNSPMDFTPHSYEMGPAPTVSIPEPGKYRTPVADKA